MSPRDSDMLSDLQATEADVRLQAVQSFALSETVFSADVFDRLAWLARNDPEAPVREASALALRSTRARMRLAGGVAAMTNMTPQLIAAILSTAGAPERQSLLSALQQSDDPGVLEPVLDAIRRETDDRAIAKMLSLIGRHGTREHLPVVERFMADANAKVQATALDAVGALAGRELPPELFARLRAIAAGHANPDLRFLARRIAGRSAPPASPVEDASGPSSPTLAWLDAIARTKDKTRAAEIARAIPRETDARVLARMIMVLKELGAREHAGALKPLLKHADPRVCANAVEALVALAEEDVLPSLFPLLVREDNRVRANLMLALYPRFPEQVMGYVRRMLHSDRLSFRVSGLYCAQFLDRGEMYPAVVDALQTERDMALFASMLDWAVDHGPAERVRKDLEDLAAVRVDGEPAVRERLARAGSGPEPTARPVPPQAVQPRVPASGSGGPPLPGSFARVTGSYPVLLPGRTLTRVAVLGPAEPSRSWRTLGRHPVAVACAVLGGVVLAVGLLRVPESAPPPVAIASTATRGRPPAGLRPQRAVVLRSLPGSGSSGVEVSIFGSPYRLEAKQLAGKNVAPGVTIWLVDPRIVRHEDGTGWLTATEVSVGPEPPTTKTSPPP